MIPLLSVLERSVDKREGWGDGEELTNGRRFSPSHQTKSADSLGENKERSSESWKEGGARETSPLSSVSKNYNFSRLTDVI